MRFETQIARYPLCIQHGPILATMLYTVYILGNIEKIDFSRTEKWYPNLSKNFGHRKLAKTHLYQPLKTRRASTIDFLYGLIFFLGMGISKIRLNPV